MQFKVFAAWVGLGLGCSAGQAEAAAVYTFTQVGSNVIGTGSGSINLGALTYQSTSAGGASFSPASDYILGGPSSGGAEDSYGVQFLSAPFNFGHSSNIFTPQSGSGDYLGVYAGGSGRVFVTHGYVSGALLADTDIYNNSSFASLGLTLGSYIFSWGAGSTADTFTIQVGPPAAPVPEPATLLLLVGGVAAATAARRVVGRS